MESVFMDKAMEPTDQDLEVKPGSTYSILNELKAYLNHHIKDLSEEWNFPGKKYGWSCRMKSKNATSFTSYQEKAFLKWLLYLGRKLILKLWKVKFGIPSKKNCQKPGSMPKVEEFVLLSWTRK